jgi:acetyl esterase/lipase
MRRLKLDILSLLFLLFLLLLSSTAIPAEDNRSYSEQWYAFETQLTKETKSFQLMPAIEVAGSVFKKVEYESGKLTLPAYLDTRNIEDGKRKPAVLYLHGGFGLYQQEMTVADIFASEGIITLIPTLRGENGNAGYFEAFMGEVHDARAALLWLAKQPYVDADNIFVFGWSVGGGVALNLAMLDDIPIKASGASAGIYDRELLYDWATNDDYIIFPFDHTNETENYFRLPIYHLEDLPRSHTVWLGTDDGFDEKSIFINSVYGDQKLLFDLIPLHGGHQDTLDLAIKSFAGQVINGGGGAAK